VEVKGCWKIPVNISPWHRTFDEGFLDAIKIAMEENE